MLSKNVKLSLDYKQELILNTLSNEWLSQDSIKNLLLNKMSELKL